MKTIKDKIYKKVIDGYYTEENFLREDKSKLVKRTIDLALEDVLGLIVVAYKQCNECYKLVENNNQKNRQEHLENFAGRLDELTLLYSDIKGINYNEAKEELKKELEEK